MGETERLTNKGTVIRLHMTIEIWLIVCGNQPRMVKTWPYGASIPISCLCFQIKTNQKAKHVLQTNHTRHTTFVLAYLFLLRATASNQSIAEAFQFYVAVIKLSCLHLCFANTNDGFWLPWYSELWIDITFAFFFIWVELFIFTAP